MLQIQYPPYFTPDLKHLLCNLLQPDVDKRYGILKNGILDIKLHCWFTTIDWVALAQKRVCFVVTYAISELIPYLLSMDITSGTLLKDLKLRTRYISFYPSGYI